MKRTESIVLRTTPAEKALIAENARASGETTSEYLRRLGMGAAKRVEAQAPAQVDGFEQRVRELSRTMPKRNAEMLARREQQLAGAKLSK